MKRKLESQSALHLCHECKIIFGKAFESLSERFLLFRNTAMESLNSRLFELPDLSCKYDWKELGWQTETPFNITYVDFPDLGVWALEQIPFLLSTQLLPIKASQLDLMFALNGLNFCQNAIWHSFKIDANRVLTWAGWNKRDFNGNNRQKYVSFIFILFME